MLIEPVALRIFKPTGFFKFLNHNLIGIDNTVYLDSFIYNYKYFKEFKPNYEEIYVCTCSLDEFKQYLRKLSI